MAETLKGLKDTLTKLKQFGKAMDVKIDAVTEANARELEANAKSYAPLDTAKLRQSIKTLKLGDKNYKVLANATGLAPYAAYMEFGTGGLVEVPPELADIAIKFKGAGKRKINIQPRPYMYPALIKQRRVFLEDLKQLLESETKKV